jgi:nitrogen fixation-related uncharacterized protein
MLPPIMKHLRRDKLGISNVIVVMLSLVLVVIIVSNVVLWSYQMNQFDWERMQENAEISDTTRISPSSWSITLHNKGSVTVHLVSLWISSPTIHQRYDINLFINAGDSINYTCSDVNLMNNASLIKVVTDRGTTSVFKLP